MFSLVHHVYYSLVAFIIVHPIIEISPLLIKSIAHFISMYTVTLYIILVCKMWKIKIYHISIGGAGPEFWKGRSKFSIAAEAKLSMHVCVCEAHSICKA